MTVIKDIPLYKSGVHNFLPSEVIPKDAAQDEQNWYTQDGRIKLIPGKVVLGANGAVGAVYGGIFGYRVDGTKVQWRKINTKIQYFDGTTWQDTVTGLTDGADYMFTNYSSLAGAFTFAWGVDGIYKMNNANPGSYCSMYESGRNFKGFAFIDKGRSILWNRMEDKTGLYGSWIDNQRGVSGSTGVYTTVAAEVVANTATGTLAFKAGSAYRNCFNVVITDTSSGEVFTDNYNGVLVGSLGGTGTINYITGAFTTSQSGGGTADYQWENSNLRGVTDFTHSATRLAGEGFQFPQDDGGDAILNVLIGLGGYYSMKTNSSYLLSIEADDTTANNNVYRKELGIPSLRGAISTSKGIVFMNTANPEKPEMTILQESITGDSLEPKILFPHFKFSQYQYDDLTMDTFERYILVACKSIGAVNNDTILLCDTQNKTVDITEYSGRIFTRDSGNLYMGSSVVQSTFNLFNGFDDEGNIIDNFWTGKDESWGSENLKKYRKLRLKGLISREQSYAVYVNYDQSGPQLVGTVLGDASYVDLSSPQSVGSNIIGTSQIGGNDLVDVYPYFCEIRLKKVPKFRTRSTTFIALGYGYLDIEKQYDWDIEEYESRIPARFRQKQNVSLDGEDTDVDNPEF